MSVPVQLPAAADMSNSSLMPSGSSALERRLAEACSGITGLNVPDIKRIEYYLPLDAFRPAFVPAVHRKCPGEIRQKW
jgi:hypothetical protein